MRLAILLTAALALVAAPACTSKITETPDAGAATEAEAGPFPDEYETIAKRWVLDDHRRITQIDDFSMERPVPGQLHRSEVLGGMVTGWRSVVVFTGRDRGGMKTGKMEYVVLIRDGEVVGSQKRP